MHCVFHHIDDCGSNNNVCEVEVITANYSVPLKYSIESIEFCRLVLVNLDKPFSSQLPSAGIFSPV